MQIGGRGKGYEGWNSGLAFLIAERHARPSNRIPESHLISRLTPPSLFPDTRHPLPPYSNSLIFRPVTLNG